MHDILDNLIKLCYTANLNPDIEQALHKLEDEAKASYLLARRNTPDGGQWDKGYWEGVKDAIAVVIKNDAD